MSSQHDAIKSELRKWGVLETPEDDALYDSMRYMKLPEKMMRFGAEFMIKYAEGMALPNKDEQSIRKFLLNIEDRTLRIVVADTLFTVMSAMGKQGMTLG